MPSHFPSDAHGLGFFDGTYLYEHADPRKRIHPDWDSLMFNYGRGEVSSFLLSSAAFWLDRYHADGLRVDAVASMLYLDYSRKEGEWEPNRFGGRENLEAIEFLRRFNALVYEQYSAVQTIAEESTSWPIVSHPTYVGGLGFGMKWDMGFMHDTLAYFEEDPQHRKFHQEKITFRPMYAFSENFTLPLSHDEVVHGKGSLLAKMPGDEWQQFANLRLLFGYMFGAAGEEASLHGRRARRAARVVPRPRARVVRARLSLPPGRAELGARPEWLLSRATRRSTRAMLPGRLRVGELPEQRQERAVVPAEGRSPRRDRSSPSTISAPRSITTIGSESPLPDNGRRS